MILSRENCQFLDKILFEKSLETTLSFEFNFDKVFLYQRTDLEMKYLILNESFFVKFESSSLDFRVPISSFYIPNMIELNIFIDENEFIMKYLFEETVLIRTIDCLNLESVELPYIIFNYTINNLKYLHYETTHFKIEYDKIIFIQKNDSSEIIFTEKIENGCNLQFIVDKKFLKNIKNIFNNPYFYNEPIILGIGDDCPLSLEFFNDEFRLYYFCAVETEKIMVDKNIE